MTTRPTPPIMMCGHAANATMKGGTVPSCAICFIRDGDAATTINPDAPSLEGRQMRCTYDRPGSGIKESRREGPSGRTRTIHADGDSVRPTDLRAAFLELRPDDGWGHWDDVKAWDPYDRYYCGCWGWN